MATTKQSLAVEKMVENGGNISQAMRTAGYSTATAKTPQKLTESKGFKELCQTYGLTSGLLVAALLDDIRTKPGKRKAELELGFKLLGLLKDKVIEKQVSDRGEMSDGELATIFERANMALERQGYLREGIRLIKPKNKSN